MDFSVNGGKPNYPAPILDECDGITIEQWNEAKESLIHTFMDGELEVGTPGNNPMIESMKEHTFRASWGLMMIDESKIKPIFNDPQTQATETHTD